nr:LysR family transcriptional regulator substrate-binding protein [uncultured Treponema sp.]
MSFGCGELAAMKILPELIKDFKNFHPAVTYDIFTANADVIKEQMKKGIIDIGILLEPIDIEKFSFVRFEKCEEWVALINADDPLAKKEYITPKDFENKPLILPRRSNVQNEILSWLGEYFDEKKLMFTSSFTTNGALMVQAGLASFITIGNSTPFEYNSPSSKIVSRPLKPKLTANSVIAWKKGQSLSPAVRKFIEMFRFSKFNSQEK